MQWLMRYRVWGRLPSIWFAPDGNHMMAGDRCFRQRFPARGVGNGLFVVHFSPNLKKVPLKKTMLEQ